MLGATGSSNINDGIIFISSDDDGVDAPAELPARVKAVRPELATAVEQDFVENKEVGCCIMLASLECALGLKTVLKSCLCLICLIWKPA